MPVQEAQRATKKRKERRREKRASKALSALPLLLLDSGEESESPFYICCCLSSRCYIKGKGGIRKANSKARHREQYQPKQRKKNMVGLKKRNRKERGSFPSFFLSQQGASSRLLMPGAYDLSLSRYVLMFW